MSFNSIIYSNTRVNANIGKMLTAEKFQRLIDCNTIGEAESFLNENGFNGSSLDEIFKNARDDIYSFLSESAPVDCIKNAFLKKNDYHNAKILVKFKYTRKDVQMNLLFSDTLIEPVKLKDYIYTDNYVFLPVAMKNALEKIDWNFAQGEKKGKIIDCMLTKAMYDDILSSTEKYSKIHDVFVSEVDLNNISSAFRIKKYSLGEKALEEEFIEGGSLPFSQIVKVLSSGDDDMLRNFGITPYLDTLKCISQECKNKSSFSDFEKICDNYFVDLFKNYKYDSADYMLYYGYIYCCLSQLKNIRIVCGGIKAGVPKEIIKESMRHLYV